MMGAPLLAATPKGSVPRVQRLVDSALADGPHLGDDSGG